MLVFKVQTAWLFSLNVTTASSPRARMCPWSEEQLFHRGPGHSMPQHSDKEGQSPPPEKAEPR